MVDPAYWLGQIIRLLKKSLALRLASTAQAQSLKEKSKNESDTRKQQSEESDRNRLNDENILKAKADFEIRLDENADLPDGIGWRQAYIYRNLMSKWFDSLIAKYRYDESMSKKLSADWLSYMYLLESESKSSLLSFEKINANEKESYEQTAWLERKQYVAIENGFAAAIGNEAIEELRRVREAPIGAFDRSGRKPMAPIGYSYVPVSLHPYGEDLKPKQP
jgi:hypothetical protein